MKLIFSPGSPFVRKVRIVAIELGLIDKIELIKTARSPLLPNDDYSQQVNPLKKLPALILDNGDVIVDSYVIAEYLDGLAGGKLMPPTGARSWQVKSDHSTVQGMLDAMLLCRYEKAIRPEALQWSGWVDDQWSRAWNGFAHFEKHADRLSQPLDLAQIALVCALGYADFRFPDCGWRKAYPKLDAFHEKMLTRPSVKTTLPPSS
jgi:glutathione S-transferase